MCMKRKIPAFRIAIIGGCALFLTACGGHPTQLEVRLEKTVLTIEPRGTSSYGLQVSGDRLAGVYPPVKGVPEGWTACYATCDFPQALYGAYCAGKVDREICERRFKAWGFDTVNYAPVEAHLFLSLAVGYDAAGAEYVMFDSDGDYDFSDETDYLYEKRPARVPMAYERVVNGRVLADTTWIELSDGFGRRSVVPREMTSGVLKIRNSEYGCVVLPRGMSYGKDAARIRIQKDSQTVEQSIGEFVCLDEMWYRLDSLSPDGRYLRLKCLPNAENLESTQIGFKPYAFTATDLIGRTIRFPDDFAGKYVLLDFWSTGCEHCLSEIKGIYPDVYSRFKDAGLEIVGVADNTTDELREFRRNCPIPWILIADRESGNGLRKRYGISGYPTLFLIGPDGRILEKGGNLRGKDLELVLCRFMPEVPPKAE